MPDAIITSTESTFGTISGTFAADQSTITGTVTGIVAGTLSGSVGVPGPQGPAGSPGAQGPQGIQGVPGAPGVGVPAGGSAGQFLTKIDGTNYNTDWTTVNLSSYVVKANNLSDLANLATARDNLSLGSSSTPTFAGVNVPGSGTSVANLGSTSLTINQSGHGQFTIQPSQGIVFPNGTIQTTAFTGGTAYITSVSSPLTVTSGNLSIDLSAYLTTSTAASTYYPLSNPSAFITASALTPYLTTSTASATYQTLAGMSDYLAKAGNLSGLANTATARTNLGLGSLAVVNDAPSDGSQYARKNGAWDIVSAGASYISSVSSPLSVTSGNLSIDLSAYAPLASPAFTGNPTAPTAAFGDNDTSVATTAFVQSALLGGTAVARNLEVEVRNQSGSTIAAGSIVYISGATGNKPLITLAQANNDANSAQTIGFVKTAIANNGTGYVIVRGELENIDTSALTEGVQLYLSPTTAGTWTTTKPSAPQHLVYVGIVIRSHPTLGTILVAVQNGYELGEIHDVAIGTLANNDLLAYESSTDLWKNKTYSALGLLTSATAASTYAPLAGAIFTGRVSFTPTVSRAGLQVIPAASEPTILENGDMWLMNDGMKYRLTGSTFTLATQLWVNTALTPYALLSGATFTGLVNTLASSTSGAGLRLPHGAAPTTPVDGDLFTTTSGLFARINGTTRQYVDFDGTQTINGVKTFSNASSTFGSSTATGTINVASGATISASTKTVNVATGGVSGSTTNTTIGPVLGASTTSIGNTTAASTLNLATGATLTATTKAVNIGTNGVAGSTTNIAIGSTTGTSTTTLQGTTNGVTVAADTNSVALATTAFVVGQAGSANPLVDGTAAVGTSLRYARQDHVHPTDTSRAALSGATFTGEVVTPASTTGTAGLMITPGVAPSAPVNGEIWATTTDLQVRLNGVTETVAEQSWVTAQGYITSSALTPYLTSATAASTYQTISGMSSYLTTASAASTYAPLASPALTGVPTAPTAANGTNTTQVATTAFVLANGGAVTSVAGRTGAVTLAVADVSGAAPLASPALTGTPTSTTAAVDTNTTQIATTAYVVGQGYLKSSMASSTYAPLASPALTGTPTAPTATAGTSTTQLATTAFVTTADNLKANLASPAFTGTPTAPTATAGTNTTQIATTAFVTAAIPTNNVKAWVNFNGTGTIAIRSSMNVTSITDNGVGLYTLNFTTAMANTNYSVISMSNIISGTSVYVGMSESGTRATSTVQVTNNYGSANARLDAEFVSVAVFA